jgi:transposase-like protein
MRREAEALATIERWRQSGKSKVAFAREEGISITTFHRWHKFYRERGMATAPASFVEVVGAAPATATRQPAPGLSPRFRLELPDGSVVIVY